MCGICGAAGITGPLPPGVRDALPAMTAALRHRGPDGDGFFSDDRAALGHARLAIIDRAGGAQPIANEDGTCQIVFNGEIYNHHDLRRELEARGHRFRTESDTEVILHSYEEHGPACVEALEGMFAFAVYDAPRRRLLLARDRLGKKPLFYATFSGVLHFASEIKALAESPLWDDSLDLTGLESYLSLGYQIAPRSIFRHVRQLEPGHWLLSADGLLRTQQYWDVTRFEDDRRPEPRLLEEVSSLLRRSVADRLESEVPLGAFLSGGIDSGLVVSYMAEASATPVITTSVGFGAAGHNELEAAELTAARYASRHHAAVLDPDLDETLDRIVAAFDEPFADASAVPTFYVSKEARRHVTVALSGDGGDETFGGYDFRYVPHALEGAARRLIPGGSLGPAGAWLGTVWPRRVPRALRLANTFENLSNDPATAYYSDLCFLRPRQVSRLLGRSPADPSEGPAFAAVTDAYRRCPARSPVLRAQYADLKVYLPNDPLVKVDRMSMAHGLEVRCPLLDRRLVEAAFRIPTSRKMPRLAPKHLLRQIARLRLPLPVVDLPKHGFTAPVAQWLRGRYAGRFRDDVFDRDSTVRGLVDLRHVNSLFDDHQTGRVDHSFALWAIWMLARWDRVRRSRPRAAAARDARPQAAYQEVSP